MDGAIGRPQPAVRLRRVTVRLPSDSLSAFRRIPHGLLDDIIAAQKLLTQAQVSERHAQALDRYYTLARAAPPGSNLASGNRATLMLNQAIAWIDTAVGGFLKRLVFADPTTII